MRVAIDARLLAYSSGGICQYTVQLARSLAQVAQFDQFILVQSVRQSGCPITAPNFTSVRVRTPPHHRLEQWLFPLEVARLRVDLLHSPDFIPPFHRRCKSVITVHDLGFFYYPESLTSESLRYYRQVRRAVQSADAIIAVSHQTARDLIELAGAPEEKITVVYEAASPSLRPLPPQEARAQVAARWGITRPYFLFVSTIEPRKNLATLLRALVHVRQTHDVELAVVGGRGWLYEPTLALLHHLGLDPYVRLLGTVPNEELPALYSGSIALVYPSLYEGFGLPPLEAMACGAPVVASNAACLPEIIGDAGLLVDPRDDVALANAMLHVLEDTALRDNLVAAGYARAARFSWRQTALETLNVYRKAAERL